MGIICPKCGMLNDETPEAETCPHCGVVYAKARAARQAAERVQGPPPRGGGSIWRMDFAQFVARYPLVGVPLALALVVWLGVWLSGVVSGPPVDPAVAAREARERELIRDAHMACRSRIRSEARRPSTVRFHARGLEERVLDDGSVVIIRSFSAESMMGVDLRHRAYCEVKPDGRVAGFSASLE